MKRLMAGLAILVTTFALAGQAPVKAAPPPPIEAAAQDFRSVVHWRAIQRFWQDYTLAAGDAAWRVFLFSGSANINGQVDQDVVVLLGNVHLGATGSVRHSVFVLAGNVTVEPGATVGRDLIIVGGQIEAPSTFSPNGEHFVIGSPRLGDQLREFMRWVTWGLLWGRIIVFSIHWVWYVLAVVFVFSLVLNAVFPQPVRAAAEVVAARPLNALLMGALLFVLIGPLLVIMAASIIGLLVVPFAICAVFLAWSIGKVGVARAVGMSVTGDTDPESRFQSLVTFLIGFALITLLYAVPVLGFVAWSLVGLFGLGAAGLTFASKLRREYPSRVRAKKEKGKPSSGAPDLQVRGEGDGPSDFGEPAMAFAAAGPAVATEPAVLSSRPSRPEPPPVAVGAAVLPHAAFLDRAAAFALDCILVAMATNFLDRGNVLGVQDDMVPMMLLIYHIVFWAWKGTTLGGIICHLRVVRTNGGPLRPIDAVVRGLTSLFSLGALGIGCLWMLQDPNRQTWHDKIAGTYVLKVPKDWPLE